MNTYDNSHWQDEAENAIEQGLSMEQFVASMPRTTQAIAEDAYRAAIEYLGTEI